MKTNKWILAIVVACSFGWVACDEDEDNPINKPELSDTDDDFVEFAARSNMAEIEFGKLAVTKGTDSLVRVFGQQMVDEHTAAQNELEDIADDYDDVDWPEDLTDQHDSIMTALNGVSGFTFDTLYLKTQIMMHESAVREFERSSDNAENTRVKSYASKYLPKIEMHLDKADSVHMAVVDNNATETIGTTAAGTDGGTADGGTGETNGGTGDNGGGTDDASSGG